MTITRPTPERPLDMQRIATEMVGARRLTGAGLPPGSLAPSIPQTTAFQRDPLSWLLERYNHHGPVFKFRLLHRPMVVLLGPEANHLVLVSQAESFSWRTGMFGEALTPVLGDGLITTDDAYHDRARKLIMPAMHRRKMDDALAVMLAEAERATTALGPGVPHDVYEWVRGLSLRIAMRALVGIDPDEGGRGHALAEHFEAALAYTATDFWKVPLRGPGSAWSRLRRARRELDALIFAEIAARRRAASEEDADILGKLVSASGEGGDAFTDQELRDQVVTLLFGGHDTTSSTVSFLIYELSSRPELIGALRRELSDTVGRRRPTVDELSGELPLLDQVLDEVLRRYPPVWVSPRRAVADVDVAGYRIPAGTHAMLSPWATHHLPDVFDDAFAFRPDRFAPEARRRLPKGAYIPFGGGQRICVGKRFGQLAVKAIATTLVRDLDWQVAPGHRLELAMAPTLSPKGGLPVAFEAVR